jgi:hypothetical protein
MLAPLAAVGLAAAACSSNSASPSPSSTAATPANSPTALLTAVRSSEGLSSADMDLKLSAVIGGKSIQVSGQGAVDFASNAMQMAMSFQGVPQLSGTSVSVILVDGTVYVSYPGISTAVPGKSWISAPASSSSTSGVQLSNASDLLKVLAAKGAVVTQSGVGSIGTTPVTRYTVRITPSAIASQDAQVGIPASDQAAVQNLVQNGITVQVFVSSSNQVRRLSMQIAVPATSTTPAGQESVVVNFTNYGAPVSISAPPAGEVATAPQLGASA